MKLEFIQKQVLSIGLLDKDTKKQRIPKRKAMAIITDIILPMGGATIVPGCTGIYTHNGGTIIREPSVQVIFYGAELNDVMHAAEKIKTALNQESIAIEVQQIASAMI